jgi:CTP:molybdopterin cytidylyltransferase MocA
MAQGSRLLVVEMVVPEPGQPNAATFARLVRQTDLEMLAVVGGRERTAAEYEALLAESGFTLDRIVPLEGMPWSVIEASAV